MTAENPDHIDTKKWLARLRTRLRVPATNRDIRKWTTLDFKLAWILREQLSKEELLAVLDVATNKRFDNRKGIDKFLEMMAHYIDGMGD